MSAPAKLIASRVTGLVLAAGRSARMGASTNKLTMSVAGRPLVAWPVEAMLGAGIAKPLVVTGFEAAAVEVALGGVSCSFVQHIDWASGMGSSLAFGVEEIMAADEADPEAGLTEGLLLCLGDLPDLRSEVVEKLLEAATTEPLADRIFVPVNEGRSGHPVLFGRRFWPALAALTGEGGAKKVIESALDHVIRVPVASSAIFTDLDTPEDMERWSRSGAARSGAARSGSGA